MRAETFDLPESRCPFCGAEFDAATALGIGKPKPGDFTVCIRCAAVLVFDKSLRVRPATPQEDREARSNLRLWRSICRAVFAVRLVRRSS